MTPKIQEQFAIPFSRNLTALRHRAGLTQRQVAEQLNCTVCAVTNWEVAYSLPMLSTFAKLCKIINATPDELLYGIKE